MPIPLIDEVTPKDGGKYPIVADKYVYINGDKNLRLADYLKTLQVSGRSMYVATIDVMTNGTVNLTDIVNPSGIKVNDLLLDKNGEYYAVTKVTDTNVTVGALIGSLKGTKGDQGEKGDPGAQGEAGTDGHDGARGAMIFVANINVQTNQKVPKTNITVPDGTIVTTIDYMLDTAGDLYNITAIDDDGYTVGGVLVNLKGASADNLTIATNEDIDAVFND